MSHNDGAKGDNHFEAAMRAILRQIVGQEIEVPEWVIAVPDKP